MILSILRIKIEKMKIRWRIFQLDAEIILLKLKKIYKKLTMHWVSYKIDNDEWYMKDWNGLLGSDFDGDDLPPDLSNIQSKEEH